MHKTRITINLDALAYNYKAMKKMASQLECGAVVKADAYGLGLQPVCETLRASGCRVFFTATLVEAIEVREILPDAILYSFEVFTKEELEYCKKYSIHPVVNDLETLEIIEGTGLKAALHIDTAMSRLGLHIKEAEQEQDRIRSLLENNDLALIMTHLSCADLVPHQMNKQQGCSAAYIQKLFPDVPMSVANSSGIMHHDYLHYDLLRTGTALYGGITDPRLKPVMTLEGQILQIRKVYQGEAIGYSATYIAPKDMMVATLSGGYADGIPRHLSNTDYAVFYAGYKCSILGRVSMDSVMVDISHIPEELYVKGAWVEFFGENIPLDEAAELAHTISYGILTGLGNRPKRIYKPLTEA